MGNILQVWIIYQNYYAHKFISQFQPSEKKCFRWLKVFRKLRSPRFKCRNNWQDYHQLPLSSIQLIPGSEDSELEYHWSLVSPFAPVSRFPQLMQTGAWQGAQGSQIFTGEPGRPGPRLLMLNSISVSSLLENFPSLHWDLRYFQWEVNTMTRPAKATDSGDFEDFVLRGKSCVMAHCNISMSIPYSGRSRMCYFIGS